MPLQLNLLQRSIIAIQKHIFNLVDQIQWADKGYFFKDITNFPSCNKSLLLSKCLVTLWCVYLNVQYTVNFSIVLFHSCFNSMPDGFNKKHQIILICKRQDAFSLIRLAFINLNPNLHRYLVFPLSKRTYNIKAK